ncbi:ribonuclease H-like domain, reverse transcriptase, RNA-dependent DNA polymerase [Tanacetum coccineum]
MTGGRGGRGRNIRMVYLGNEHGSKAYRLFDPTTQRICVSRDVKFKENEKWDWSKYLGENTNDEPEWTDFRIGNLEETSDHHQLEDHPMKKKMIFITTMMMAILTISDHTEGHFTHHLIRTLSDIYENTEELLLAEDEPKNYKEASNDQKWIEAMKDELDSINRNNTWKLTSLPPGHKAIGLKWVFKTKRDADGKIIKHKARLVAKGYIQEHGIDFEEVFAPVHEWKKPSGLLTAIAANNKMASNNTLTHTIWSDISIKQSAYARKILKEAGMLESNETLIPMDPGTRLTKTTEGTMVNSTDYRSLIGCLRYLLHTRPDLSYSVGLLSRFMQEPKEQHMKAIKQVLRYVKGTKDYGITYKHNGGNRIHGYSDSSYGVNTQEGKGTTGIIFYYGESQ